MLRVCTLLLFIIGLIQWGHNTQVPYGVITLKHSLKIVSVYRFSAYPPSQIPQPV